jgi:hypothetical protein
MNLSMKASRTAAATGADQDAIRVRNANGGGGGNFPGGVNAPHEKNLPETDREIATHMADVISLFSSKVIGTAAPATDDTVKEWRNGGENGRCPRLPAAVRMARKVPLIQKAILELINAPDAERLLKVLEEALTDIAVREDEAGEVARKALREYRALKKQ